MSSDRLIGSVKWFNNKAGYGFVTIKGGDNDNKDVFVHYSAIKVADDQFRYLVQGEYIEFDLAKDESGKHDFVVSNVSGIKGGSLMCEVHKNNVSSTTTQRVSAAPRVSSTQRTPRAPRAPHKKPEPDADGFVEVVSNRRHSKPVSSKPYMKPADK
jgi:CspA family cold shock protein